MAIRYHQVGSSQWGWCTIALLSDSCRTAPWEENWPQWYQSTADWSNWACIRTRDFLWFSLARYVSHITIVISLYYNLIEQCPSGALPGSVYVALSKLFGFWPARELSPSGELNTIESHSFEFLNVEMQYESYRGKQARCRYSPETSKSLSCPPCWQQEGTSLI